MTAMPIRRASFLLCAFFGASISAALADVKATILETDWRAAEINGAAITGALTVELRIEAGGAALGRGGCNRFTTKASIEHDMISFAPIGSTRMACSQDAMRVEASFFDALEATRRFSFDPEGGELYLHDSEGSTLVRLVTP
jgi:putative lipoprotein